jgi:dihydrolipoamide dehydrogenase
VAKGDETIAMVMGELEQEAQVVVVGGGPGGYAAAFRAADMGLDVTLVDASPRPGGVCLFDGCIPSKTLLFLSELIHDADRAADMGVAFGPPRINIAELRRWKTRVIDGMAAGLESLARKRGVQIIQARARFESSRHVRLEGGDIRRIAFEKAIIATGSQPGALPDIPLAADGRIMDSAGALALKDLPARMLVVGGGYIGLELGSVYASLGTRIDLVESGDRLLKGVDEDIVAPLTRRLKDLFDSIRLGSRVTAMDLTDDGINVQVKDGEGTTAKSYDRVLVAVGRTPASRDIGLENTRVQVDDQGFIQADNRQRTHDANIYAVGDVIGGPMLAHKASREGKVAAEVIAGQPSAFDTQTIPAVVYTDPQIAWCGLTETVARQNGIPMDIRRFPWKYSGRAATMGLPDGLTKLIVDPESGRIVGAAVTGRHAEGLIAEAVLAIEMGALADDLALSIHPHPTLSETESEAAELFSGSATHMLGQISGGRRRP